MGHETRTANNGVEAIEVADQFQPNVALLDIGMPKLNGYETARRMRQKSWGREMLLVAVTGWGQDADRRRSDDAGFNSHLVKPVNVEEIERLLSRSP
jgi:CheY-like chemotaxis protein